MARKPRITKQDAAMIALRHAAAHGISAAGTPEVSSPLHDHTWTVLIPDGTQKEPGGTIVIVDQATGEPSFLHPL